MSSNDPWDNLYHYYHLHRETFLQHYHRRSLVESTFMMLKAKFGATVRSKGEVAQVNELLCKVLCHNICVLMQSMFELGIEPDFSVAAL
jgi:transposase